MMARSSDTVQRPQLGRSHRAVRLVGYGPLPGDETTSLQRPAPQPRYGSGSSAHAGPLGTAPAHRSAHRRRHPRSRRPAPDTRHSSSGPACSHALARLLAAGPLYNQWRPPRCRPAPRTTAPALSYGPALIARHARSRRPPGAYPVGSQLAAHLGPRGPLTRRGAARPLRPARSTRHPRTWRPAHLAAAHADLHGPLQHPGTTSPFRPARLVRRASKITARSHSPGTAPALRPAPLSRHNSSDSARCHRLERHTSNGPLTTHGTV